MGGLFLSNIGTGIAGNTIRLKRMHLRRLVVLDRAVCYETDPGMDDDTIY
jgi:hypothetical protein